MNKGWRILAAAALMTVLAPRLSYGGSFISVGEEVLFQGDIAPGDDAKLENLLKQRYFKVLFLQSDGGDPYAAMKMGSVMRSHSLTAAVGQNCYSACVFVLAGAVQRVVAQLHVQPPHSPAYFAAALKINGFNIDGSPIGSSSIQPRSPAKEQRDGVIGRVAIHRPFFASLPADWDTKRIDSEYKELHERIVRYFFDMNMPLGLVDAMYAVPPDQMRLLNKRELDAFSLDVEDAVHEEKLIAGEASAFRISSMEYRKRMALADQRCPASPDFKACEASILGNIPMALAKDREARWEKYLYTGKIDLNIDIYACRASILLDGAPDCTRH